MKPVIQKIPLLPLLLCLLLLLFSSSLYAKEIDILSGYPPYLTPSEKNLKHKTTYTGKDFDLRTEKKAPDGLYAKAYCLYDAKTGQVLYGKNEQLELPMASTTKIMTCILALEHGRLSDSVTFSSYAASMPDVQLHAIAGESFSLEDLLYSLMLESHNDTAVAIAEHIGGSVENFADMMNEKAKTLGCKHTHFVTPNGLDAKDHYTTAADLCQIAAYAIKNKTFTKIIKTPSHAFMDRTGKKSYQANSHNLFLSSYEGAIGIKTGFTGKAGYCFCGAAKRNGTTLITSVLASGFPPHKTYKWSDTKKLMNYGFANYRTITITPVSIPGRLSIYKSVKVEIPILCKLPERIAFTLSKKDTVTHCTELPSHLHAPIRKGDIVGYEKYYQNNTLLYQFPIYAGESADVRSFAYYHSLMKKLFYIQKTVHK